ncbi:hypothetical protein Nepgr_010945 [Nepenthes gracilis]|uniref:Exportin-1 C-terminal domain-containing protein n=1 Tax=Nepenthes gracilis TaxID=150966 RepID=A0AAD3XLU0_NEPGR|nr:hypothetical protein Nepgr_010945 [Nepenthes gracilis]
MAAEKLRDMSQPIDVALLDATVAAFYGAGSKDEVTDAICLLSKWSLILQMITKNFEDYPEHRLKFFSLLRAIATHCFPVLIRLLPQQLKLVMDSIIWAFCILKGILLKLA